jgi:hypothetical protein
MGQLVFRRIALPVPAFDALQRLKREWRCRTNNEVLTRVLLTYQPVKESAEQAKEETTPGLP